MEVCRRGLLAVVIFVCAGAQATFRNWTGAGSGWSDAASWSPAGVPAADDTVAFAVDATVTPDASFAGTVVVSNGTLRVVAESALSFSLAAKTGTTFEKTGSGTLTLKPLPAYDAGFATDGAVSILGGPVVLSGNGRLEAPGYFGALSVAAGASVTLAEAAAADRHGVITRMPAYSTSTDTYATLVKDRATILARWSAAASGNVRFYDAIAEGDGAFHDTTVKPDAFTPSGTYVLYLTRGVVLTPGVTFSSVGQGNRSNTVYWNGEDTTFGNVWKAVAGPSTVGWATLGSLFEGTTLYPTRYVQAAMNIRKTSGLWGVDELWNGVCVKSLSLAAGATLALAADQAFAVADGASLSLAGTLTGEAGSVFAIMGGEATPDWTRWEGFAGTLELGAYATLHSSGTDFSARPFTFAARGTVVAEAGTKGLTAANCTGIVQIPAGATLAADAALLAAAKVTGDGCVATSDALSSPSVDLSDRTTLALADGARLTYPVCGVSSSRVKRSFPAFTDSAWQFSVMNRSNATNSLDNCRVYENGSVLLTEWAWTSGAIYYDRKIGRDDTIDFTCTVSCSRPTEDYPVGNYAEGWSVVLNTANAVVKNNDENHGGMSTACGFHMYMWLSYKVTWFSEGNLTGEEVNLLNAPYNFVRDQPITCRVGITNATMTVTVLQGDKLPFTASRNFSCAFRGDTKRYFGLTSTTGAGTWGDASKSANFVRTELSAPSGTVEAEETVAFGETPDAKSLVTADDWAYQQNMCCTNTDEINLYAVPSSGLKGSAVNTNRFDATRPFKIAYDYLVDWTHASGYVAEGPAIFFQGQTATPAINTLNGNGMLPWIDNCIGLWRHYYGSESKLWASSSTSSGSAVKTSGSWGSQRAETGEKVHVELVYDGEKNLSTTETRTVGTTETVYEMTHDFDQFATYTDGFFVGFSKSGGSGDSYVLARIAEFGLYRPENNAAVGVRSPLVVAAGASATVATATLVDDPTEGVTFSDVSLGAGATLAVEPTAGEGWIGAEKVTASSGATLAVASGAAVSLCTVTLVGEVPTTLTVTGAWRTLDGALTIIVPDAWRAGFLAVALDRSLCADATLPTVTVKTASGARTTYRATILPTGIYVSRPGLTIAIR